MKHKLKPIEGMRVHFSGTFVRYGSKDGWHGQPARTLLLKGIRGTNDSIVAEYHWFFETKAFGAIALKENDRVVFTARVKGYRRSRDENVSVPEELDYKLSHPTKIKKLE